LNEAWTALPARSWMRMIVPSWLPSGRLIARSVAREHCRIRFREARPRPCLRFFPSLTRFARSSFPMAAIGPNDGIATNRSERWLLFVSRSALAGERRSRRSPLPRVLQPAPQRKMALLQEESAPWARILRGANSSHTRPAFAVHPPAGRGSAPCAILSPPSAKSASPAVLDPARHGRRCWVSKRNVLQRERSGSGSSVTAHQGNRSYR